MRDFSIEEIKPKIEQGKKADEKIKKEVEAKRKILTDLFTNQKNELEKLDRGPRLFSE